MMGCVILLATAALAASGFRASAQVRPVSCPGLGNQTTTDRPGLVAFNGRLYLAWTGTNGNGWGNLNFISTTDGVCYSAKTVSPQTSIIGPALAVYNGKLWAAYVAVNAAHNLCLMSSSDGVHWSSPTVFTRESSGASLAMTAFNGALFLAWTGTDHASQGYGHLFMLTTTDGVNYSKQEFTGDTAPELDGPGLTQFTTSGGSTNLELAWTGTNNPSTIWAFQSPDGVTWINHTNTQISGIAPSLAPNDVVNLYLGDIDFNSNKTLYQSGDGRTFNEVGTVPPGSDSDVAVADYGGVWMAYTSVSSGSDFHLGLSLILAG